jgi:hypothetical protein
MPPDDFWPRLETLLSQAGELSSAGDPSAACERARLALDGLDDAKQGGARADEFRARARFELGHYLRLLARWQVGNAGRAARYLERERSEIRTPLAARLGTT